VTVEQHIHRMEELFGQLPNPDHSPKQFQYYVDLYKFYLNRVK